MGNVKIRPYENLKKEGLYNLDADVPTITYNHIGKRGIRRIDGYAKASGKAVYTKRCSNPGDALCEGYEIPLCPCKDPQNGHHEGESLAGGAGHPEV